VGNATLRIIVKIKTFTSDRSAVEAWLSKLVASLEADDHTATYWFHPGSNGFGFSVLAVPRLGELHLFEDGRLTMRIERNFVTELLNAERPVAHFAEFEEIVRSFVEQVIGTDA
jgi:hypothetical protein